MLIALIGAGPAPFTVTHELTPSGYDPALIACDPQGGALMHTNTPSFHVPVDLCDEKVNCILDMDATAGFGQET